VSHYTHVYFLLCFINFLNTARAHSTAPRQQFHQEHIKTSQKHELRRFLINIKNYYKYDLPINIKEETLFLQYRDTHIMVS